VQRYNIFYIPHRLLAENFGHINNNPYLCSQLLKQKNRIDNEKVIRFGWHADGYGQHDDGPGLG
jgi:hypothetical protein